MPDQITHDNRIPSDSNPFAVTSSAPGESPSPARDSLLLVNDRTNIGGRLWSPCMQTLYPDRLELKFLMQKFTLPIERIGLLRSGGKGVGRHLEIVHDDDLVPETLHLIPLFPAKWYEAFEILGIPTEDQADLRPSKQYYHRSSVWVSNAEGLFWMLWISLIIAIPAVLGVVKFFQALLLTR